MGDNLYHFDFFNSDTAYCLHFMKDPWKCVEFTDLAECDQGRQDFIAERHGVYPPVVVAQGAEIVGCIESDR